MVGKYSDMQRCQQMYEHRSSRMSIEYCCKDLQIQNIFRGGTVERLTDISIVDTDNLVLLMS